MTRDHWVTRKETLDTSRDVWYRRCMTPDVTIRSPRAVSVPRAAELLGISRSAAYRLAGSGEIPTVRLGRRLLVPVQWLDDFLVTSDWDAS